jgi:hypothetical protein
MLSRAQQPDCDAAVEFRCRVETFDGKEGRKEVAAGPLADPVNGQPRSTALTAALDNQYFSPRRGGVLHHAADGVPRRSL